MHRTIRPIMSETTIHAFCSINRYIYGSQRPRDRKTEDSVHTEHSEHTEHTEKV